MLEKTDHAERVLDLMGTFGADTARFAIHHPWAARLARDAEIGASRHGSDMRLAVFHYPLQGWTDAVGDERSHGPGRRHPVAGILAPVLRAAGGRLSRDRPAREAARRRSARKNLSRIVATEDGREAARLSVAFWRPRVAASFGREDSTRFDTLKRFGLRHRTTRGCDDLACRDG